jgi:hypothetical protein
VHTRTLRAAFNDGGTEVRIDGDGQHTVVRRLAPALALIQVRAAISR